MNDLIELKLITREDAECLHKLQIEAFMPLYEKYQDDATSPAKESLETITKKIVDDNSNFYFILFNGEKAGAVRVKWHKWQKGELKMAKSTQECKLDISYFCYSKVSK